MAPVTSLRPVPTIFALATGAPPTAIAIVRISGPGAIAALRDLTGRGPPPARRLTRATLVDPASGERLDEAMVVVFPGPASVTGDDLVELHVHGGIAVVAAVLAALDALGLTAADPGAFTRRAFDNGKLDLGQVEAFGDLIGAETDGQRRAALTRTGTRLAERVAVWRSTLVAVRGDLEATLDFADEDGVPAALTDDNRGAMVAVRDELGAARADAARAGRLRDGVVVAITGPVNAGKSTLLNALARHDAAMVSRLPGTTRDVIEVRIALDGVPVTLVDTAGLRATEDATEAEGIRRGTARAAAADLVITFDGMGAVGPAVIRVVGKSDLDPLGAGWRGGVLYLAAATGDGLDLLERELSRRIVALTSAGEAPLVAHRWQASALDDGVAAIDAALAALDIVLAAEHSRRAINALERLVGRVSTEDLLDAVFARFCIGK